MIELLQLLILLCGFLGWLFVLGLVAEYFERRL